jgi:integrase
MCPATAKGKAYTSSGLFRRISGWFKGANVATQREGAGILRNTFAQNALTCGQYTPEQVQEFLGHEMLRATVRHNPLKSEGT